MWTASIWPLHPFRQVHHQPSLVSLQYRGKFFFLLYLIITFFCYYNYFILIITKIGCSHLSKFYLTVQHWYISLALSSLFYSSQAIFKSFIDPSSKFVELVLIMEVNNWFSRFQSPCSKLPCQNDGTCVPLYRTNSYKCRCTKAYTGSHCEKGKFLVSRTMFLKIFRAVIVVSDAY